MNNNEFTISGESYRMMLQNAEFRGYNAGFIWGALCMAGALAVVVIGLAVFFAALP